MSHSKTEEQPIVVRTTADGRHELKLAGEVNVFLAAELQRTCLQLAADTIDVVVDCAQLRSLDFAALQVLLAFGEALGSQGRVLGWTGLSHDVRETLATAGAERRLGLAG